MDSSDYNPERGPLAEALAQLNDFLGDAIRNAEEAFGPHVALDGLRGLHLSHDDVTRLLERPDAGRLGAGLSPRLAATLRADALFGHLVDACNLDDREATLLLIALAPEIDSRYERIYAFLQDDITQKRPSLGLVQQLLANSHAERLALLQLFDQQQPLIMQHLLILDGDPEQALPRRTLRVDPQIIRLLLQCGGSEQRLQSWCRQTPGSTHELQLLPVPTEVRNALESAIAAYVENGLPIRLHLQGPPGSGKRQAADALAGALGVPLLAADLRGAKHCMEGFDEAIRLLLREAWLCGGMLLMYGFDSLLDAGALQDLDCLAARVAESSVPVAILGSLPWPRMAGPALGIRKLLFGHPDIATRTKLWRAELEQRELDVPDGVAEQLGQLFKLTPAQIAEAVAGAQAEAGLGWRPQQATELLANCARAQCGHALSRLATRIAPRASLEDLILPTDTLGQLHEIHARVATRELVHQHWARHSIHARGRGVTALFAGPSGTGKTLAAEALAHALGLDLYRIDLAGVVSKYIGETEKNLDRVFAAAEDANAVLFFDEAEALFGKRSEVKDAHDRYANIEIAYLLQKMEQFDGLAILATNMRQNLDEAFVRRLTFSMSFPFPETAERERLWEALWLPGAARADDIDLAWFAREFRLSGGNIRNTVLAAAHLAAADGKVVTRDLLLHATRREFQKLGKNLLPGTERAA